MLGSISNNQAFYIDMEVSEENRRSLPQQQFKQLKCSVRTYCSTRGFRYGGKEEGSQGKETITPLAIDH